MSTQITLEDPFKQVDRPVMITGVQALVRMMLLQAESDKKAGLNTGGFVSGYRGSPLGTLDSAFARAGKRVPDAGIVVQPAVNEEMGATAIAGTQQIAQSKGARVEGVFSLWYGKGPGVDRASDAIRHGNSQGTSPSGGVVLAVGDDHMAKSSSIACYTDPIVAALLVPLLFPSDADDIILFGLHSFAMSRLSGSWVALKILPEVADASFTHKSPALPLDIAKPEFAVPPDGLHNRWPDTPLAQEERQINYRLPAINAYMDANPLDRIVGDRKGARIGLLAAGKSWNDVREALRLLGIDEDDLPRLGVALFKPAMIWPLQSAAAAFASGLDEVIVVEEKLPMLEDQLRSALYGTNKAPAIYGKSGPDGAQLFKATAGLNPELVAKGLYRVLLPHLPAKEAARIKEHFAAYLAPENPADVLAIRKPFFCSGCPHNRSTQLPEGSRALAGIGCHGLAAYNRTDTSSFAQMGGEGVHWVGLSHFTDEKHVFANIGDGTYFHSGLLAIRQAVAANVNMTYKLLFNSAVAMTGGQHVDGEMSVESLAAQLRAEGVKTLHVVADQPDKHRTGRVSALVDRISHRNDLDAVQRELREVPGVSVIIYDQHCATESRRLRKRGKMVDPDVRAFINPLVCEGCGDCSVQSNCLSVEPVDTEFGTKRRINQSSCNKDFSCINGFCPSFIEIKGAKPRKNPKAALRDMPLPAPTLSTAPHDRVVVAGIGGTGVVTIGALLTTAAHIAGDRAAVLDQIGMAQKGGSVASHIHIARGEGEAITALRMPARAADVVLACDSVVAASPDILATIDPGRTHVLVNSDIAVTGDFTRSRDAIPDRSALLALLSSAASPAPVENYPFSRLAERLVGDAIGANLMMVGFAYQRGWLGISEQALQHAVELNGQAVALNRSAFAIGRRLAVDPQSVTAAANLATPESETLDTVVARRTQFLIGYQNEAYANRFAGRVRALADAEARLCNSDTLATTAARSLFKLMAYKDEYEVARLMTAPEFRAAIDSQFESVGRISYFMAPPVFSPKDPVTGVLRKRRFGSWMRPLLHVLARMKRLRGTALDPLGRTGERRTERALITEYEALLDRLARELAPTNHQAAVRMAALPMEIRGFGHVKDQAVDKYRAALTTELKNWSSAQ